MRQVLPIVGAVVGSFIPGLGTQAGFIIGSLIGNAVDPQVLKGPSIGDGQATTANEGNPINIVYGTATVGGQLIDRSEVYKTIKRTRQGKGGPKVEEERFSQTFAIAIGEGAGELLSIMQDEKLVYDVRAEGRQISDEENAKYAQNFRFYRGTEEQLPDPALEGLHGVGNTPAYRGLMYIVFERFDTTDRGGSIPNFRFEVSKGVFGKVFPSNRVPCVRVGSSSFSGGWNTGSGNNSMIDTFAPLSGIVEFNNRLSQKIININLGAPNLLSIPWNSNMGSEGGGLPRRWLLRTESGGGGNVVWSSGWICHTSQINDVEGFTADLGEVDVIKSFQNEEEFNEIMTQEVRIPNSPDILYIVSQNGLYRPNGSPNFQRAMSCIVDAPDGDFFDQDETIAHPRLPASLLNFKTGDIIWTCWAGDEYDIEVFGEPTPIYEILDDIALRCKINPNLKFNHSDIMDLSVRGFVISGTYPAKNAIESLQETFFFDTAEYNERLNFIPRGKDAEITITNDNLIIDEEVDQKRESAREYPNKVNLLYQNAIIRYDKAKATAELSSDNLEQSIEKSFEVPIVFNEDEAAQVADKQLKIAWAEADGEFNFTLPTNLYDQLVPSDVFWYYNDKNDTSKRFRIIEIERADGELKVKAKTDRQSAYVSNAVGMPVPVPMPPPPTIAGPTEFVYLNIPALVDQNDVLGYYVSATGSTVAYRGSEVERKTFDIEEDFDTVASIEAGTTMGYLLSDVSDASEHYSDTTNTVHLKLYNNPDFEVFQTVNQNVLLRENNAIAIAREDGTAEIIQFRDVENLGNGEYKLSYLLRGRLNSGTDLHEPGAKVVWLEDVHTVLTDSSEIGDIFEHRATSYGESPENSQVYINDYSQPLMQTEFPVDLLRYEIIGGDLIISWSPRERFGSDVHPIRSQNWEHYKIEIQDGGVLREYESEVPNLTVPTSTFNSNNIEVIVYQVNRFTDEGPGVQISVEL